MRLLNIKEILAASLILYGSLAETASIKTEGSIKQPRIESPGFIESFAPYSLTKYTITVESRDTLERIAEKISKLEGKLIGWQDVYNQNKDLIKNPNLIYPEQELTYTTTKTISGGLTDTV